ncbi:hypothetical protein ACFXGR_37220 [Streptomyces mirabilis]|uniref:hypothetical protein n=1 Tax=Streptomyces mirabilis TaxID=68239 RepID=UPI00368F2D81
MLPTLIEETSAADKIVTVYTDRDFQGKSQGLKPGAYDASRLKGGEDFIRSVRVPDGWTVCLYEDAKFGGSPRFLTSPTRNIDNGTISSLIVTDRLPPAGIEQNDVNITPKSARITQSFPPKFEQIMVLSFTMTIEQPQTY